MLYAKVVLWVKQEETTSDSRVILYRGDRNVDIEFTLKSVDYILSESVEAQLVFVRPHAKSVFSRLHKINQNKVRFTITGDMIDELDEREAYAIQIRLFGPNTTARVTLPPCYDVMYIREPIAVESFNKEAAVVNAANVNYSLLTTSDEQIGDVFTNGEYNKTRWFDGDLITDSRLNKIESALHSISETNMEQDDMIETHTHDEYVSDEELEQKGYLTEHQDISHLATQTFVEEKISEIESGGMTDDEREQLEKNTSDITTILGIIDTPPTYTKPTLSVSFNTSTFQHNKETNVTITPNFKQNDAGGVSSYVLSKNGVALHNATTASAYTDTVNFKHGESISYSATVSYKDGPIKNTLLGIPYPNTSIKAGNISASGTIKAYALSYYGVINKAAITEDDITSLSSRLSTSKSFTHTVNLSEQRIIYMYPQSFGALTSIKDANNFDYINSYTRTTLSHDGVSYYVYILTDPVTITGFKQIFN